MTDSLGGAWGDRFSRPVFILTADQDWAPDWAVERLLTETLGHDIPLHVFVTNPSQALEEAAAASTGLTLGVHPNFLPGSSHGASPSEVIDACRRLVPSATTFRCHSYFEYTSVLGELFAAGFVADSNLCLFGQAALQPLMHCTGLLRLPVFFEDDVFYNLADRDLSLEPLLPLLATPGLKILNFHPALIALNAPSENYYNDRRDDLFRAGSRKVPPFGGRGSLTILRELTTAVRQVNGSFVAFPELVVECLRHLADDPTGARYGWGVRSWAFRGEG